MPNLRRIPRTVRRRPRVSQRRPVARTEPHVAELELNGVRWLNIEEPTAVETAYLAEHFDFHELDLEDVLSTPSAAQDRRVRRVPVHGAAPAALRQDVGAAERGRAERVRRPGLPDHAPQPATEAGGAAVHAAQSNSRAARGVLLEGLRLPALRDPVRAVRLLLPDPRQDRVQARPAGERDLRGARRGRRPRHLQRQAGDHRLPQDHQARARHAAAARARPRPGTCPKTSRSTSTTSSTPPSGSGISSTTTRRSSRRWSRPTSR